MKRIITCIAPSFLLSLALCFSMGCSGDSGKAAAKVSEETATTAPADTQTAEVKPDTAQASEPAAPETEEPTPAENTEPTPAPPATGNSGLAARTVDEERLSVLLDLIAQDLESQKLVYDGKIGQDCSGIYHKIKDQIQRKMSELGDKSKYVYPTYAEDRNSRQIAYWYYTHNNLHIVQDALADRNLIRPGCVMFFGRTDEKYSNLTIDMLTNPDVFQHDSGTGKGKIYHVGTVTKVERDEQGNVVRYTLMHGRNTKYTASRTSGNYDGPGTYKTTFAKFPFGNWNQQWVAVAHIETPVQ
ncbi:MAG: hypothetical protein KDC66_04385 [Phaeodactylibacter sp.]|nr:hypothetical protein [Phaeodactylibacter sp.]MCB9273987.1 hypothetical protein [Lewinellaceae bacterium]